MTFSIVARDPASGDLGVAVASRFLAVGATVPYVRAGVGAMATQALANVRYGPEGLALLARGVAAGDVVDRLVQADRLRHHRQVGVVDAHGAAATYTGASCSSWAGARTADGVAAQGNILAGPTVVDALIETYLATSGRFADRLATALLAADRAGGDRRGRQSAALVIERVGGGYLGDDDDWLDLRVDDHPDPVIELVRLVELHELTWERPRADDLVPLDESLAAELRSLLDAIGAEAGPIEPDDPELDAAFGVTAPPGEPRPLPPGWDGTWQARLSGWMGMENMEMRAVAFGWIDQAVLDHLRRQASRRW